MALNAPATWVVIVAPSSSACWPQPPFGTIRNELTPAEDRSAAFVAAFSATARRPSLDYLSQRMRELGSASSSPCADSGEIRKTTFAIRRTPAAIRAADFMDSQL